MGNSAGRMGNRTTAEQAIADLDLKDKICIVTGCNSGIGKEAARVLALRQATVIMACRSVDRGNEARKDIVENLKKSNANFNENLVKVLALDLSSLQSIKQFVIGFTKEHNRLHYLINNAGCMAPQWEPTKEDYELQFGSNHLGHFYLTLLLTDVLKQSKPSRVVVVSSDLYARAPNNFVNVIKGYIEKSNGPSKENYSLMGNYAISKACNLLFAREYNRRYHSQGVICVALHPGVIATDLSRNLPSWMAGLLRSAVARPFLKTVEQGAATTIRCCSLKDDEIKGGHYYRDCNDINAQLQQQFREVGDYNELTDDKVGKDQAYLLWQLSEKLITQKNFTFDLNENVVVEQKSNVENNTADANATATATVTTTTTTTTTDTTATATISSNVGNSNNENANTGNNSNQIIEEEN